MAVPTKQHGGVNDMNVFKLELKRVLALKSTWVLLIAALIFSAVLAYLPVTYCYSNGTDAAGNAVSLKGVDSIQYEKARQANAAGVVTPQRVRQAAVTYHDSALKARRGKIPAPARR